jgi:O-antigen/teichoic acid export membrane protein
MRRSAAIKSEGLIKHGTVLLVATVITGLSNTVFNIIMYRMLSTEDFGDYYGLVSLYMILVLPLAAVQTVTARYVSALESRRLLGHATALLRRSVIKLSAMAVAALGIFLVIGPLLAEYLNVNSLAAVYFIGLAVALALVSPVFWGALQGFQYFYHYAANQLAATLAKLGGGILMVWLGLEVAGAVGSLVFFQVAIILIAVFPLKMILFKLSGGEQGVDSRPHYRFFWPVLISLLAFAVFTQADILTAKHFFDRTLGGEYGSAKIVGNAFLFVPIALSTVMFPKVSQRTASGREGSLRLLNITLGYCVLLCGLAVVICAVYPGMIMGLLFPESTEAARELVRIFGLGITPVALLYILINYLLARGRSGFLYLLLPLAFCYVLTLQLMHATLATIIWIMAAFGLSTFILLYLIILRGEHATSS